MGKKTITTIEITDTHIKCVQCKPNKGKQILTACDVKPISEFSDEEIIRELRNIISTKDISTDDLTCVIPRRFTILKHLNLPSTDDNEIKKMAALQLVNQIPYTLEDVIYDFHVIKKDQVGYTQVLAIVVHKDISKRFIQSFRHVGINLHQLTLSSFGILYWLKYQEQNKKIELIKPFVVVNIDVEHTEICFCQNDTLIYSRSVPYGARELSEEGMKTLLHQIELSMNAYVKEAMGPEAVRMIIISDMKEAEQLKDKCTKKFDLPVDVFSTFWNVFSKRKINLDTLKNQIGISLTVLIGLNTIAKDKFINLAPKEVHVSKQAQIRKRQLAVCTLLVCLTFLLSVSIFLVDLMQKTKHLNSLKEQNDQITKQAALAKEKINFINVLRNKERGNIFIPDLIDELYSLVPAEISFRSLSLDEKGQLVIQGYSSISANVNQFQQSLLQSEIFEEVGLQFATNKKIFNQNVTDYKFICQLTQRGDASDE